MKKAIKSFFPYLTVLSITILLITVYLYSSHVKLGRKSYVFPRTFPREQTKEVIQSITGKFEYMGYIPLPCGNGYINKDSTVTLAAIVPNDSLCISYAGFYRFNPVTKNICIDSCLTQFDINDNYHNSTQRQLAYDGSFYESEEYITYTCRYMSDIYIFDKKGHFFSHLKTKDNVPVPSIIRYKEYYILERGKACSTNIASVAYNGKLYVMSFLAKRNINKYIIDCYDIYNKTYMYSFYIDNAVHEDNCLVCQFELKDNKLKIVTSNCKTLVRL